MSGPEGLSQASGMEEGAAGPKGQPGDDCVVGWSGGSPGPQEGAGGQPQPCSHPERTPFSVGGAREDRELLQAHYPKKGPSSLPRAEE